ncbi:MAG TPA: hypothetical protein VHO91_07525 [Rhodopila sp.]|nr:hypothetical protein [Rhodopila sp.]
MPEEKLHALHKQVDYVGRHGTTICSGRGDPVAVGCCNTAGLAAVRFAGADPSVRVTASPLPQSDMSNLQ